MRLTTLLPKTEAILKAVGHPDRFRILSYLSQIGEKGATVTTIYSDLKLPQAIVSQHLMTLRVHSIVVVEKFGTKRIYRVTSPEVAYLVGVVEAMNEKLEKEAA